jgi:hypothetical protein
MISSTKIWALTDREKASLASVIDGTGQPQCLSFYAVSGDDVYAVIDRTQRDPVDRRKVIGEPAFVYVKLVCSDPHSHEIADYRNFSNQFEASVFLCEEAAEEERGFGRG